MDMLDFFEKSYYFELERKSKIQSAAGFPLGLSTISIGILKYNFDKLLERNCNPFAFIFFSISIFALIKIFIVGRNFLDYGSYEAIPSSDEYLSHFGELRDFSKEHPLAPSAAETIEKHLTADFSKCATINAGVNDRRAEQLYDLNVSAYVLILSGLVTAAVVMLEAKLG